MFVEIIETDRAPEAVGAYSQGTVRDGLIFTSGQIALDPGTGEIIRDDFEAEARQVLDNLLAVVEAGGGRADTILKTTVFLTDLSLYADLNEVYEDVFQSALPARSVVEVASLPKNVRLEIEAVAEKGS